MISPFRAFPFPEVLNKGLSQQKEFALDLPFTLKPEELGIEFKTFEDLLPKNLNVVVSEIEIFNGKNIQGGLDVFFRQKERNGHAPFPPFTYHIKGPVKMFYSLFREHDHEIDVGFSRPETRSRGTAIKDNADKVIAEKGLVVVCNIRQ